MKTLRNLVNVVIIIVSVISLSSCGSLGGIMGSGTVNGIISEAIVGQAGMNNTEISRVVNNVSGRWRDRGHNLTITTTPRTPREGIYLVSWSEGNKYMYLAPITDYLYSLPSNVSILSYQPVYDSMAEALTWVANTTRGELIASPVTKNWSKCTRRY